ncbi:MAG TPA: hypothetical protein VLD57_01560 [Blastocatellia bacterium]|nr:hypothetical protein [Blastocatellia bacterium]
MLFDWRASVSGVTLGQLEQVDDSKPFPASLELATQVVLRKVGGEYGFGSTSAIITERDVRAEFRPALDPLQHTLKFILDRQTADGYPVNKEQLSVILSRHGVELNSMRDPWGNQYRADLWIPYDRKYVRRRYASERKQSDERRKERDDATARRRSSINRFDAAASTGFS